jgi:hypothetical protein
MRIHDKGYKKPLRGRFDAKRVPPLVLLPLFVLPFILPACSLPATLLSEGEAGAIALSISTAGSKTLLPAIDMVPAGYDISGSGPNGRSFSQTTALTSIVIPGLAFGQWTVTVNAKNQAGTLIAQGSATILVSTGVQSPLTIVPVPLQGNGKISLAATWVASDVQTASIDAQLTPGTGSPIPLSFSLAAGTASCQNVSVPTGYYTLSIRLLDNGLLVMGAVEVVRIVKDQTTAGTFDFTQVNKPGGAIAVSITPLMSEPLAVAMQGQAATLPVGGSMTVADSVAGNVGNVLYVWYINGESRATGSNASPSFTVGSSLPAGVYRLDVTAFTADGKRAGAASAVSRVL